MRMDISGTRGFKSCKLQGNTQSGCFHCFGHEMTKLAYMMRLSVLHHGASDRQLMTNDISDEFSQHLSPTQDAINSRISSKLWRTCLQSQPNSVLKSSAHLEGPSGSKKEIMADSWTFGWTQLSLVKKTTWPTCMISCSQHTNWRACRNESRHRGCLMKAA